MLETLGMLDAMEARGEGLADECLQKKTTSQKRKTD